MSEKVTRLLQKLDITVKSRNIRRIQFLCNKLIENGYEGLDVKRILAVSHIKMKSFKSALAILETLPITEMKFEKAYCLYCLNDFENALILLETNKNESDTKELDLLAQIYYNLNEFGKALDIYNKLQMTSEDGNQVERNTNIAAVKAFASLYGLSEIDNTIKENKDLDNYEGHFNNACYYIGQGDYLTALLYLKKSFDYLENFAVGQTLTKFEKIDLAMITVQMAFVEYKLGNFSEAKRLIESDYVKSIPDTDVTLKMVAKNNQMAIYDSMGIDKGQNYLKTINKLYEKSKKLIPVQNAVYYYNNALIMNRIGHRDQAVDVLNKLKNIEISSNREYLITMAETDSLVNERKFDQAIKIVQNCMKTQSDSQFIILLAHLYHLKNDIEGEIATLQKIPFFYSSPSLVYNVFYTFKMQVDHEKLDSAVETLVKCAQVCMDDSKSITVVITELVRLFAQMNCPQKGYEILEKLKSELIAKNSHSYLTNLIDYFLTNISYFSEVEEETANEMDLSHIFDSLKVDMSDYNEKMLIERDLNGKTAKPKRKRKHIVKKVINGVETLPDPERWLPKYERSNYKPDKKKKKTLQFRGTQGVSDVANIETNTSILSTAKFSSTPHTNRPNKGKKRKKHR